MMVNRVLVLASVASMIDQFNMPNIKLLKEMGYDVHVACNFNEGNTCSDDQITILKKNLFEIDVKFHQIDFKRNVLRLIDNIKAYKQVHKLASDYKYKFIHCHSPIGGVVGRLVGKTTNTKVIYTAHGFHFYKGAPLKNWIIYYPIEKWLSRYTDVLITINKEDEKRARLSFNASNVCYIPGVGIPVDKYKDNDLNVAEKRKELMLHKDAFVVLSVGELNKNKNHEIVICAIKKLDIKNIHYVICGRGPLKSHLEKIIDEMDLSSNVHLVGFRSDIKDIYKISDLFVLPSFREGLSVALMEAMASGLPCVVSRIRGNTDLIDNNGGALFNPTSIDECSDAIVKVLNSNRQEMDLYNAEKVNKFSIDTVVNQMREIYSRL